MSSSQIRQQFVEFFEQKHGHAFVPSSSVVPHGDNTLLFANAGMNQFKPIFLGEETRDYQRAVNSQKCIRAGGKHNDLDDVGKDSYHHTFFEMLGNWSFGDYFKAEAMDWAWELLVEQWGLDPDRLHATYFEGDAAEGLEPDTEARDLWLKKLPADHVHPGNKKDNFWEMGDTGPCGPCSELHYDRSDDKSGGNLVNADGQDIVVEIWNLVFIQFNRAEGGKLTPLPAKHVDTGMGFERIVRVLQGKSSNYDTDVFTPLLDQISQISGKNYNVDLADPVGIAFRAIADHARMAAFSIADGAVPENKGRGSVLRSVIRRAVRFGYQTLDLREPFLHRLVGTVAEQMGDFFPEVREKQAEIEKAIRVEESDFLRTIERGLTMFAEALETSATRPDRQEGWPAQPASDGRTIPMPAAPATLPDGRALSSALFPGRAAFDLHTTYGFPIDLTRQLAEERGLAVDMAEYDRLFEQFQKDSGKGRKKGGSEAVDLAVFPPTDDSPKHAGRTVEATVFGWVKDGQPHTTGTLEQGDEAYLLLDRTSFYAEQGGQVGDVGSVTTATGKFLVADTERRGGHVLHWGQVDAGTIEPHQRGLCDVDLRRSDIMRNHTGTHLLNLALRRVLGDGVAQRGSLVDHEKLRFDFSHDAAVTPEQLAEVERIANEHVRADAPVQAVELPLKEAQQIKGVKAVFGEKYPDPVRVIAVGEGDVRQLDAAQVSVEFCGGTHLRRAGEIGLLKIVAEESVSRGIRRIVAVTGRIAIDAAQAEHETLRQVSQQLNVPADEVPARVAALQQQVKDLEKKLKKGGGGPALDPAAWLENAEDIDGVKLIIADVGGAGPDAVRGALDYVKKKADAYAALVGGSDGEKVGFVAACADAAIAKGLKAGDWIRPVAQAAGGNGGGRPNLAQAGGKNPAQLAAALQKAREVATAALVTA
jgi:alanyl-tRNA synthetase